MIQDWPLCIFFQPGIGENVTQVTFTHNEILSRNFLERMAIFNNFKSSFLLIHGIVTVICTFSLLSCFTLLTITACRLVAVVQTSSCLLDHSALSISNY